MPNHIMACSEIDAGRGGPETRLPLGMALLGKKRSRYSNRAVNHSNRTITLYLRSCFSKVKSPSVLFTFTCDLTSTSQISQQYLAPSLFDLLHYPWHQIFLQINQLFGNIPLVLLFQKLFWHNRWVPTEGTQICHIKILHFPILYQCRCNNGFHIFSLVFLEAVHFTCCLAVFVHY